MFEGVGVEVDTPVAGFHVAGGCVFAPGRIVNEIPYDPLLYFHGEEQALALRAWTRGWDASCGCFGTLLERGAREAVVEDLVMLGLLAVGWFAGGTTRPARDSLRPVPRLPPFRPTSPSGRRSPVANPPASAPPAPANVIKRVESV